MLLNSDKVKSKANIQNEYKISTNEVEKWKNEINDIKLSKETLNIIHILRTLLFEKAEALDIYVSDRRWKKIAFLLKASAFFCERQETNLSDLLLINKELYYTEDIYDTKNIKGNEYFKVSSYDYYNHEVEFFIDKKLIKINKEFYPVDINGNELKNFKCNFKGTGSCEIKAVDPNWNSYFDTRDSFSPKILYYKGKKGDVSKRLISSLSESVDNLINDIEDMIKEVKLYKEKLKDEIDNPFIYKENTGILLNGINNLIDNLKIRKVDCEKIKGLIQ